jgi:RNA recognition motif-containing protein
MGRRLYVGNLPYKATDEDLMTLFSTVGDVASARVMRDMATGRARGFGFVEMTTDEAAQKAIEKLHQHQMEGRAIVVNEAQPKPAGGGRGFGGGGGAGRGGNRGGGGDDFSGGGSGGGRREPRW